MPDNTVYVGRPSRHGNPFKLGKDGTRDEIIEKYKIWASMRVNVIKDELRGKDLACFCRLDQKCHADVLLEIANS